MKRLHAGERLMQLARWWADPAEVERFVEPAIADLQHEWALVADRPTLRDRVIRWTSSLRVLGVLVHLSARARGRSTMRTPWYALGPAILAVAYGVRAMDHGGVRPSVVALQWVWLVAGLVLAWLVATTPRRTLEPLGVLGGYAAAALLVATARFGESVEGASRWLSVGPLNVQVSILALPMLLFCTSVLCARGRLLRALAVVLVAQGALVAQPDGAAACALALSTIAAALAARVPLSRVGPAAAVVLLDAAWALHRDPSIPTVAHVEEIWSFVVAAGPAMTVYTAASLALVPVYVLSRACRAAGDSTLRGLATGTTVSLVASILLPLVGPYPVPLVGYGGSNVMACFLSIAFVLAISSPQTGGSR